MLDPTRVAAARSVGNQDWLSSQARDYVAVACFAGYDRDDLLKRIAMTASRNSRTVNLPTVIKVMQQMRERP